MGIAITTLSIGNLSLDNVTSIIAEALGMEDDENAVRPLATAVHKKTSLPFFVLVYLKLLRDDELLQFNKESSQWTYDMDSVNTKLATKNVDTMVLEKLRSLDEETQSLLKLASCLGMRFSLSSLDISMNAVSINELEGEGLWEKDDIEEDVWKFSHDKIQQAAYNLIDEEKRNKFRGKLGDLLYSKLEPKVLETNLFQVVSLRNCHMDFISDEAERLELAKLNLRAARKVRCLYQLCVSAYSIDTHHVSSIPLVRHLPMQHLIRPLCIMQQGKRCLDMMAGT